MMLWNWHNRGDWGFFCNVQGANLIGGDPFLFPFEHDVHKLMVVNSILMGGRGSKVCSVVVAM